MELPNCFFNLFRIFDTKESSIIPKQSIPPFAGFPVKYYVAKSVFAFNSVNAYQLLFNK